MKKGLARFDESICTRVKLMSIDDANSLYEAMRESEQRIVRLMDLNRSKGLNESDVKIIRNQIVAEGRKLERLQIVEGVSSKNFFQVQQHFRSMVRAASVIGDSLGGSLGGKMTALKTEGIELLNALYDDIKDLESNGGEDLGAGMGIKVDRETAVLRDQFVKVFTDFAILFRGTMGLADMFSNDPASIGGYNEIQAITSSLEREQLMDDDLKQALAYADHTSAEINPKKGFFSRFTKQEGLTGKFKSAVTKGMTANSPGFSKLVNVNEVIETMMVKSMRELLVIFKKFNQFVAADVDVNYLLSVTKNSNTLSSIFKTIFDAFGSTKGGMRVR